jgi:hypothetical protein
MSKNNTNNSGGANIHTGGLSHPKPPLDTPMVSTLNIWALVAPMPRSRLSVRRSRPTASSDDTAMLNLRYYYETIVLSR